MERRLSSVAVEVFLLLEEVAFWSENFLQKKSWNRSLKKKILVYTYIFLMLSEIKKICEIKTIYCCSSSCSRRCGCGCSSCGCSCCCSCSSYYWKWCGCSLRPSWPFTILFLFSATSLWFFDFLTIWCLIYL